MHRIAHLLRERLRDDLILLRALRRDLDAFSRVLAGADIADEDRHAWLRGLIAAARARRRRLNDHRRNRAASPPRADDLAAAPPHLRGFAHRGRYLGATALARTDPALLAALEERHLRGECWTLQRRGRLHIFVPCKSPRRSPPHQPSRAPSPLFCADLPRAPPPRPRPLTARDPAR